jgi:hypothetical protein
MCLQMPGTRQTRGPRNAQRMRACKWGEDCTTQAIATISRELGITAICQCSYRHQPCTREYQHAREVMARNCCACAGDPAMVQYKKFLYCNLMLNSSDEERKQVIQACVPEIANMPNSVFQQMLGAYNAAGRPLLPKWAVTPRWSFTLQRSLRLRATRRHAWRGSVPVCRWTSLVVAWAGSNDVLGCAGLQRDCLARRTTIGHGAAARCTGTARVACTQPVGHGSRWGGPVSQQRWVCA